MLDKKYYISIDVGGTNARIALMEQKEKSLRIKKQEKFRIAQNFDEGILDLVEHIKTMTADKKIQGIGAAFPGIIDSQKGVMLKSANLPQWQQKPLSSVLQKAVQIPTFIFHDVTCAAAGEAYYGYAASENTFVYLIWGTGFGGTKVEKLFGKLHVTPFEPGHYMADVNGEVCLCGQRGCPEIDIGGGALEKKLGKQLSDLTDSDQIWGGIVRKAGQTLVNTQMFHPTKLIVMGGGLLLHRQFLITRLREYLKKSLTLFLPPQLKISKLEDNAALYGAVVLQQVDTI